MERLGLAVLVAVPLFVFSAAACAGSHRVESAAPIAEIGEMRAKQQVIERYRSLVADKYLLNLADNTYVTFPPVTERDFNRVELQGAVWSLKVDPPMGVSIVARVARDGSWTEIVDVGYASE